MRLEDYAFETTRLPGVMPIWHARVDARQWSDTCRQVRDKGGRLVALWAADNIDRGQGNAVHAALAVQSGLLVLTLPLSGDRFPDISENFPAANRMQRAAHDLVGVAAEHAADDRKWLRHASWPADVFPLRKAFDAREAFPTGVDAYPFVQVGGEGVHEIPVGPVHA